MGSDRLVRFLFRVWSPIYDHPLFQRPFYRRVHRAVLEALGPARPAAIVDLGCGTAQLTADLRSRFPGAAVIGADPSAEMLAAGRARLGAAAPALVRADVYALPLRTASIDLVTSTISYHFYREPRRALAEIRRTIRPGGLFVLATMASPLVSGDLGAMRLSTAAQTRADLEASGFAVKDVRRVRPAVAVFVAEAVRTAAASDTRASRA